MESGKSKSTEKEIFMEMLSIERELMGNSYPGRGIIIGKSADGTKAVAAYFIMGRSVNSRLSTRLYVYWGIRRL